MHSLSRATLPPTSYLLVVSCGGLSGSGTLSVQTTGTTYGSTATYNCATGYVLSESSTRTCQANGLWSGSVPSCTRTCSYFSLVMHQMLTIYNDPSTHSSHAAVVSCGSLTTSGTGGLTSSLTGTTYGNTATYSCTQTGYELVGAATRTCQSNGLWSGSEPYCTRKTLLWLFPHINFRVPFTPTLVIGVLVFSSRCVQLWTVAVLVYQAQEVPWSPIQLQPTAARLHTLAQPPVMSWLVHRQGCVSPMECGVDLSLTVKVRTSLLFHQLFPIYTSFLCVSKLTNSD